MAQTTIEWTHTIAPDGTKLPGYTFNGWWSCTKHGPECLSCYAETFARRLGKEWGPNAPRYRTSDDNWEKPLAWNRKAEKLRMPLKVFAFSMGDVFEDYQLEVRDFGGENILHRCTAGHWTYWDSVAAAGISCAECGHLAQAITLSDIRRDLYDLIDATPWLDWLVLTKRPENIRPMWRGGKRRNVWLGTTAGTQKTLDKNAPEILKVSDLCENTFISGEPLLEPMDVMPYIGGRTYECPCGFHRTESELIFSGGDDYRCAECGKACKIWPSLSQIIVGGESGHHARHMHPHGVRMIRDQCAVAGVPFFFKQWGEYSFEVIDGGAPDLTKLAKNQSVAANPGGGNTHIRYTRVGKEAAGNFLDGRQHLEFPLSWDRSELR